ncbi:MAG: hypothetical protein ABI591_28220 [Kofleriaceae bacterium]
MRRVLIALLVSATAFAAPDKKPKTIDAKANAAKLDVWKDDIGQFYVVPQFNAFTFDDAGAWVFYGDGKTMYQQRIIGSGTGKHDTYEWSVWSPRVTTMNQAEIESTDNRLMVTCGVKDKRLLTQLKADEAKALFAKATFLPPLWQRNAKFLARDDDGVYYFVDMLSQEAGGNGYRVFIGQKGSMKEQAMTNVVADSGGEIYATKSGNLKIISDKKADTAFWIKGGKKVELTVLVPLDNRYLIYRGLGIYGQLGVVCDDL